MKKTNKKLNSLILVSVTLFSLLILIFFTSEVVTAQNVSPKITETRVTVNGSAVSPAIYGDRVVYQDYRNGIHIYMYNLSNSKETQITINDSIQWSPAIYGDRIIWTDERNGEEIYMYNLSTFNETRITNTKITNNESPGINHGKIYPAIYEDRIIWLEVDNGNQAIYMYNLSTGKEIQIAAIKSYIYRPAIYGDRIVWSDGSNGKFDIYMYNLLTENKTQITKNGSAVSPVIFGDKIVWQDDRNNEGNSDIYMYNLSNLKETQITTSGKSFNPSIYNDRVVWRDSRNPTEFNGTVDEMPPTFYALNDIYMYDLSTLKEYQITANPSVDTVNAPVTYGDRIVWQDARNNDGTTDIYMATLVYLPSAVFSAYPISGNAPMKVNFTDKSTGLPTSWSWNFGDGANSSIQNPEHTYSKEGNYTVNLTVSNAAGIDTKSSLINVKNVPHKTPDGFNFIILTMIALYLCKKSIRN
jgi:beta propeller repeat protein